MQVRQHVEHKKTFMFLEQLILKHHANQQCVNIKDIHEVLIIFIYTYYLAILIFLI